MNSNKTDGQLNSMGSSITINATPPADSPFGDTAFAINLAKLAPLIKEACVQQGLPVPKQQQLKFSRPLFPANTTEEDAIAASLRDDPWEIAAKALKRGFVYSDESVVDVGIRTANGVTPFDGRLGTGDLVSVEFYVMVDFYRARGATAQILQLNKITVLHAAERVSLELA